MRVDRQACSQNHAGGSFWDEPERRCDDVAIQCGPSKEAIREYMARRRTEESPPPGQGEIQRRLGWKLEPGGTSPGSEKRRNRIADTRENSGEVDSTAKRRSPKPTDQNGFVRSKVSMRLERHAALDEIARSWTMLMGWMRERLSIVSRR